MDERVQRNLDDTSTVINTTKLDVVIEGLDSRLAYAVAFAASTVAGIGSYSKETVIGGKKKQLYCNGNAFKTLALSQQCSITAYFSCISLVPSSVRNGW